MLVLMVWGFEQFYLHGRAYPGRPLTPPIRNIIITHGVAMTAWVLLLMTQPLLIVSGKYRVHMALGKIGAVLAVCVIFLGMRLALAAAGVNPPDLEIWGLVPRQFLAIQFFALVMFAGYVGVGIWNRKHPEIHRPMMLFATLTVLAAALDRIDLITHLYAQTIWGTIFGPFFWPVVIGAALWLVHWALTRKFSRPFAVALVVLTITGPVIMKLAPTHAWDVFASSLLR